MKTIALLDGMEWHDAGEEGRAEAVHFDRHGRALRWTLRPGQTVREFTTEKTPIYVVVLQGKGIFAGADGEEHLLGPGSLIVYHVGEPHSARTLDEDLVFVAILHEGRA